MPKKLFLLLVFLFGTLFFCSRSISNPVFACDGGSYCTYGVLESCHCHQSGSLKWCHNIERDSTCPGGLKLNEWEGLDCTGCEGSTTPTPKAAIAGYITLNGGQRVGPGNLTPSKDQCGSAYGGVSCLQPCLNSSCYSSERTCCWNDFACVSGTCTPVLGGIDITNSEVSTGWWCPTEIYVSGGSCCGGGTGIDDTEFCRRPIDANNINFSMSGMTVNQTKSLNVTGVPAGYTCDYTFTINGTPTSGTGCTFTSPSLPEGTHSLVVNLREDIPAPPAYTGCAYGPELITNPYLTNLTDWSFYNNGNTSYSFSNGIAKLTSAGGNPVSGGFTQQIAGLAGKRILYKAALRRKAGGSAGNPYVNIGIRHSSGTWEYNYPSGISYFPSSSDTWEIVGNSTSFLIPNDVTTVMPAGNIWNAAVGDYYVGWISMCEEEPIGTILGRVVNEDTGGYLKSSAVCATGTVASGLSVGIGTENVLVNQCDPDPYYAKSLLAANYTVTANVPAGWEALSWGCTSWIGGVRGGTSCPTTGSEVGPDWANGIIATDGYPVIPLKKDEQAHVWFWIQSIAPTCQIFGPSEVTYGTNWVGTTTASVPGSPAAPVSVESAYSTSSTFPPATLGTQLGTLNGTGTTPALNISWTPVSTDIGKTYYFYCRGNNGLNWASPLRQCRPFAYGAYPSDVDCWGTQGTCQGYGYDCIPVEVKEPRGWFQVKGGDVHSQTSITSPLPPTASQPYFNLDLDTYPGLISYVNSHNFSAIFNDPNEVNLSSSKKWLAQSSFSPAKSTYNYFYQKLGSPTTDNFSCTDSGSPCPNPPSGTKIYYSSDSVTISGNDSWSIPNNSKVIVLVNGNLTISLNTNKKITVANGGFLAFIVKGDIKIEGQVGNKQTGNVDSFDAFIQGIYISSNASDTIGGTIETVDGIEGVGLGPGFRFTGSGSFYAQRNVILRRNLKKDNATDPAELFLFRPDLVINAPYELWSSKIDWQEVVP